MNATRQTVAVATNDEVSIESTKGDYSIVEDTKAIYGMVEFPIGMDATLITGVRWTETEFSSTGYMSLENDDFEFNGAGAGALDIAIPLPEASITYSEFFPSAHLKWEASEDILVRAAVWTSFTRPSFKQARAYAIFDSDIELCPPGSDDCDDSQGGASLQQLSQYVLGSDNALDVGNPNLLAMTSVVAISHMQRVLYSGHVLLFFICQFLVLFNFWTSWPCAFNWLGFNMTFVNL